jgi:hypothetical protein
MSSKTRLITESPVKAVKYKMQAHHQRLPFVAAEHFQFGHKANALAFTFLGCF